MRTLFYLSESQLERIKRSSLFPGVPCVDDQRVVKISDMLSSMDFSGRMLLMSTAQPCTTIFLGGVNSEFSTKFSMNWQIRRLLMAP